MKQSVSRHRFQASPRSEMAAMWGVISSGVSTARSCQMAEIRAIVSAAVSSVAAQSADDAAGDGVRGGGGDGLHALPRGGV